MDLSLTHPVPGVYWLRKRVAYRINRFAHGRILHLEIALVFSLTSTIAQIIRRDAYPKAGRKSRKNRWVSG